MIKVWIAYFSTAWLLRRPQGRGLHLAPPVTLSCPFCPSAKKITKRKRNDWVSQSKSSEPYLWHNTNVFVYLSWWACGLSVYVCVCVRWGDFYIQRKKCARSCVHSLGSSLLPSFPPWKERVHREQQMSRHWPLWWQKAQAVVKRTHWAVIPALHHLPIIKAAASCPPTSKQTRDLPSRRGMVV